MSWFSSAVHHAIGLPEIDLRGNPATAPLVDPLIADLESEIFTNKLPAVLDQLPPAEKALMLADVQASIARDALKGVATP